MKKSFSILAVLVLLAMQTIASPVSVNRAAQIGLKFAQSNMASARQITDMNLAYTHQLENGTPALYIFDYEGGFVVVSADDAAQPILGFSEEGSFDYNNIPDGLNYYLGHYARQIAYAVENGMNADEETIAQWQHVEKDGFVNNNRGTRDAGPFITLNWNQDSPYNRLCPTHNYGPGGHVYVGCVADAMAMVMKFWNWPEHGEGTHSYTPQGFPQQTADFENTYYDWNNMPNQITTGSQTIQIEAIARLMWHCGIAVDMQYGYDGSGAYSEDVVGAIKDYFRYCDAAVLEERDDYTKTQWEDMLIESFDEGFPVYYAASDNTGGHAFVCDGYRSSDRKMRFNWGWSGYGNGYFAIDALNAPGYQFNQNQRAVFNFLPDYIYDALIPAVDMEIAAVNANSKTGVITWTNPITTLGGQSVENLDQVLLFRNGELIFSQNNVAPGEVMQYEDVVANFDCYSYRLYFVSNGIKGRFSDMKFQYGPACTWKVVGQTTNFQGWNGGKIQVYNAYNTLLEEITMTSTTPISQQIAMPQGDITIKWVAPSSNVNSLTINIKNSANQSVYSYTGGSNNVPATLFSGDNDCGGCLPPTDFTAEYTYEGGAFGALLMWSYDEDPQSFKVYRSNDGFNYECVATVDKTERQYFDEVEAGTYFYKVTAYRSYCESTPAWTASGDDFVLIEVTSVEEDGETLSVYPNPANTTMSVSVQGLSQVTVFNVMGQVVYSESCNADGIVINTSNLVSGIYTISIKSACGNTSKRFTVMH